MKTIDEAWQWYIDVKATLKLMERIGVRCWDSIPWNHPPWQGYKYFAELEKNQVIGQATNGLQHLDDLAVVVLFSVFEAMVRGAILERVKAEEACLAHRITIDALESAKEKVEEGSFYYILSSFKGTNNVLIEHVNQVRKYRNWVSHGKRGPQPALVTPLVARDRLLRCHDFLLPTIPDKMIKLAAYYIWEEETNPHGKATIHWNKGNIQLQEMVRTGQLKLK